jgi:4-hydroxy-tetrahydrodipicolinate synthase
VKFGTSLLGKSTAEVRLPLVPAGPEAQERMREAMRSAGVLN